MVDYATRDHEAGVESTSSDSSERVPCSYSCPQSVYIFPVLLNCPRGMVWLTIIKPIPETVEAVLDQVFRSSEVEPRVEFVNDAFKSNDGEQASRNGCSCNCT